MIAPQPARTVPDLLADPYRIAFTTTQGLERLNQELFLCVTSKDAEMSPIARERMQQLRSEIAATLAIRRRLDAMELHQEQQAATMPQDAPEREQDAEPDLTEDQALARTLRALLTLAARPPADDSGNGGRTVRRPTPPTRPTPPSQAVDPVAF